jgi:WD40 repeat protein
MKTIRIFISSPGDVAEERERAKRVVESLRKRYAGRLVLETVLWEELPLGATMSFQEGIDQVILSESYGVDVAVFVLWSRLGSPLGAGIRKPDGTPYRSGTEREFDLMLAAFEQSGQTRPRIFAYVRQDQDGFIEAQRGKETSALGEMIRQRELVESFIREEFHDPETGANLRAYHTFPQPATFAVRLRQHLRALLDDMAAEAGVPVEQQWEDEPYLGLRAFDLEHAPIFFGREQETGSVLEALQAQQRHGCAFVLLVGGSGSGKSSLVRAGVIPDLLESGDEEGIVWRRAVLTPGECADDLLPGLARALLAQDAIPELREDDGVLKELAEAFAESPKQAAQQVRRALQRLSAAPAATHLVLLVDQFEEVFTHAAFSEADIQAFAEALKALAECGRVSILATVRSDYYGRCQQVPALMAMKAPAGQIDLVAPGQTALARIIGRPAQLAGLRFEENRATCETLDQRILADIGNNPEALPLVEFALTRLWENRAPNGTLTFAQYDALGGVAGAIGHHAEAVYKALPDDVRAEFAAVFNALVTLNEADDTQPVRRRVALDAVTGTSARKQFVEALTDARLLTSDRGELFVAHEALLRVWDRAVQWIEANRDFLRVRTQVDQRLNQSGILVPEDPLYDRAKAELTRSRDRFTPEQTAFIEQAIAAAERKQRRARRIRRAVMAGLSGLTILSVVGGIIALWQWRDSEVARINAEESRIESEIRRQEADQARDRAVLAEAAAVAQKEATDTARREADTHRIEAESKRTEAEVRRAEAERARESADAARAQAEISKAEAEIANQQNLENLRKASNADLASALKAMQEDLDAKQRGQRAEAYKGKSRWHEAVALLGRALERNPNNQRAAIMLFDTIRHQGRTRREWPSVVLRHEGIFWSASFSPNGMLVVTTLSGTSGNMLVQLWDAVTGQTVGEPWEVEGNWPTAFFCPDGTRVVTREANLVRFTDASTGRIIGQPLLHPQGVSRVSFSPDGMRVITTCHDKAARIWDVATGRTIGKPMRHADLGGGSVNDARFSPDGKRVVTAGHDGTARVWDADTGQAIGIPLRHDSWVFTASFSPDGTRIVSAGMDKTARIWDANTGQLIGEPLRHESAIDHASFSPDGMLVVTASRDGTARLWDAATGAPIGKPMQHERVSHGYVQDASFSPDGRRVVTVGSDKTARVWDAATGNLIGEPLRHENEVRHARFNHDGTRVLTTPYLSRQVWIWETPTDQLIGEPIRPEINRPRLAFNPDGTRVVIPGSDGTARIWDVATGKPIGEPMRHEAKAKVESASFSPDGTCLVTASSDKTARVWDAATGKPIGVTMQHESQVSSAVFSPDGRRVVTTSQDMAARIWDADTGAAIGTPLRHESYIWSTHYSPDGTRVVTASMDRTARIWDANTGQPIGEPMQHGDLGEGYVTDARFSPDGRQVITASWDRTARVWDANTGTPVGEPLRHESYVKKVVFSPDGTRVVTSSDDKTSRIWDALTGELIGEPMRHVFSINEGHVSPNGSFSPDGLFVITAGARDQTARIWDAFSGKLIREPLRHNGSVGSAMFSPDGMRVVTTAGEVAYFWDSIFSSPRVTPAVLAWATGVAGLRFRDDGEMEIVPASERIEIVSQPNLLPPEWGALAEWVIASDLDRPVSVTSRFTARQIAERERDFSSVGTMASLTSALEYDYTLPLTRLLLANALEKDNAAKEPEKQDATIPARAAHLRRYDLDSLPDDVTLWTRAARALIDASVGAMVGIGPKAVTAKAAALPTAEKAVALLDHDKPCPARLNLAHAYLFNGQFEKAKAIHAKYLGTAFEDGRKWNDELRDDFKRLRAAGHDHPDMKNIEALLGAGE